MAPLVREIAHRPNWRHHVIVTGQHREMLDPLLAGFEIGVAANLGVMKPGQSLPELTGRLIQMLPEVLDRFSADYVFVQGDTTSSFCAALVAFYAGIPVVHLEAGLRSGVKSNPFPEEMNRQLTSRLTTLHMAPTPLAKRNLLAEAVTPSAVFVTGNTVIDALLYTVAQRRAVRPAGVAAEPPRMLLVTCHRRESWGEPLEAIAQALRDIAQKFPRLSVVLPLHRNPVVREPLTRALQDQPNVRLLEPQEYTSFAELLDQAYLVLTDSGGVQEEAPALGKPVLVMRETTERPEAILAGTARLVGVSRSSIVDAVSELLTDERAYHLMAQAVNPYGDGHAARRTADAVEFVAGLRSEPPDDFEPA